MKKLIAIALIIAVLALIAGCQQKVSTTTSAQTNTDTDVSSMEKDIAEIDAIEDDTGLSDLDSLEQDLGTI